jgi:CubicO group peptidase (beta-lactamase class C family)
VVLTSWLTKVPVADEWAYFSVTFGGKVPARGAPAVLPLGEYRLSVEALSASDQPLGKPSLPIAIKKVKSESAPLVGIGATAQDFEAIRAKYDVPALAGAVVTSSGISKLEVVGLRKHGSPIVAVADDRFHLGSNTKAMTATLLGMLIERQQHDLSWGTTLGGVFPDWAEMDAEFRQVTLEQLAAHRGGVYNLSDQIWQILYTSGSTFIERRRAFTRAVTKGECWMPGELFSYDNANFVILAAVMERKTGKSWEKLMQTELFTPLGMSSAGFGAPGVDNNVDAPWGHSDASGQRVASRGDNPPEMGPAGNVHASLADWGRFIRLHMTGSEGALSLSSATLGKLHQPYKTNPIWTTPYGWGWRIETHAKAGKSFNHDGFTGGWYSHATVFPSKGIAIVAASNIGPDTNGNGRPAVSAVKQMLLTYVGL